MSRIKKCLTLIIVMILLINMGSLHTKAVEAPNIKAENAILVQMNTDLVMYAKNADEKIYPAFVTKVMTALVVYDQVKNLSDKATVGNDYLKDIDAVSSLAFKKGEQIPVNDLLYCMMVSTSSEAANILAQHVSGSNEEFVKLMNDKAKQLGTKNTLFTNPHGIDDGVAYTTARDAVLILKCYANNEALMKIADTTYYEMPATNVSPARRLYTTNYLLLADKPYYLSSAKGIKNSYNKDNGYGLSAVAEKKKNKLLVLVFNSTKTTENNVNTIHSFTDAKALVNWAFDNFVSTQLLKENTPCAQVKVNLSQKYDSVTLVSGSDFKSMMPQNYDQSKLVLKPVVPKSINAPVEKGQKIGQLEIYYSDTKIGAVDLLANSSIKVDMLLYYGNQINSFFSNIWVKISAIGIVVLFLIYIIYTILYNRKRAHYRSVKRRMRF